MWHVSPRTPIPFLFLFLHISSLETIARTQLVADFADRFDFRCSARPRVLLPRLAQVQGAYFDFAGQWTKSHTFKGTADVVSDGVLRDFKNFVYKRQKEVR